MKLNNYWLKRKNLKVESVENTVSVDVCRVKLSNSHVFTCYIGSLGGVNVVKYYPLEDRRPLYEQNLDFKVVREYAEKLFAIKKEISAELLIPQTQ